MGAEFSEFSAERQNTIGDNGESGGVRNVAISSPGIEVKDERGNDDGLEIGKATGLLVGRRLPGITPNGRGNGPDALQFMISSRDAVEGMCTRWGAVIKHGGCGIGDCISFWEPRSLQ